MVLIKTAGKVVLPAIVGDVVVSTNAGEVVVTQTAKKSSDNNNFRKRRDNITTNCRKKVALKGFLSWKFPFYHKLIYIF